jgi:hypothetical protein
MFCHRIYTFAEFNHGLLADAKKAFLGLIQICDQQKDRGVGDNQKHRGEKVSVNIVRELYGVMKAKNAARGVVVTYGSFTQDASDFAKDKPIDLVTEGLSNLQN